MVELPISLSDPEMAAILSAAAPLQPRDRGNRCFVNVRMGMHFAAPPWR